LEEKQKSRISYAEHRLNGDILPQVSLILLRLKSQYSDCSRFLQPGIVKMTAVEAVCFGNAFIVKKSHTSPSYLMPMRYRFGAVYNASAACRQNKINFFSLQIFTPLRTSEILGLG
jgi:hypothetical protein